MNVAAAALDCLPRAADQRRAIGPPTKCRRPTSRRRKRSRAGKSRTAPQIGKRRERRVRSRPALRGRQSRAAERERSGEQVRSGTNEEGKPTSLKPTLVPLFGDNPEGTPEQGNPARSSPFIEPAKARLIVIGICVARPAAKSRPAMSIIAWSLSTQDLWMWPCCWPIPAALADRAADRNLRSERDRGGCCDATRPSGWRSGEAASACRACSTWASWSTPGPGEPTSRSAGQRQRLVDDLAARIRSLPAKWSAPGAPDGRMSAPSSSARGRDARLQD